MVVNLQNSLCTKTKTLVAMLRKENGPITILPKQDCCNSCWVGAVCLKELNVSQTLGHMEQLTVKSLLLCWAITDIAVEW